MKSGKGTEARADGKRLEKEDRVDNDQLCSSIDYREGCAVSYNTRTRSKASNM